jgi:tetratricopeptide (TPR) repeat protein
MRVGERAHLWTTSDYGYGTRGNFSFPTIPPNTDLLYDIELIDFEPPAEGKSHSDMTFEERLESAERRRLEGNELFKAGQYEEALGRYSVALSFVDEDLMIQIQGFHYDKAIQTRVPALLNSSACHLKLSDYNAAISSASQVLTEQPGNAKALFRRGTARNVLGQTDAALQDLAAAKKAAPSDPAIARELKAVLIAMKEQRQAGANLFRGLLDKEDAKELYSDDDNGDDDQQERKEERNLLGEDGGGNAPEGFFASFMQALCPFIFGRPKYHEQ